MDLDKVVFTALGNSDDTLLKIADEGGKHEFSSVYTKRMNQLTKSIPIKSKPHALTKRVLLVAVVVTTIAALASVASGAPQGMINRFFVKKGEQHIVLQPYYIDGHEKLAETGESLIPSDWGTYWIPQYISEGYTLESADTHGRVRRLRYTCDGENTIEFLQHPRKNDTLQDDEGTVIDGLFVNGFHAFAVEKSIGTVTYRSITWSEQNSIFGIEGSVPFDELIKIGESIIIVRGE